ncbi:Uncharacterised protein [Segatella copri]|nr:Uncharacterised protein [Segatella copri]
MSSGNVFFIWSGSLSALLNRLNKSRQSATLFMNTRMAYHDASVSAGSPRVSACMLRE